MTATRVTAGPFTLELPPNGVALLYEADEGGTDHLLPGGVGHFEALVQFAGEVIRLRAMVGQMQKDRNDQDMALRDAIRETVTTADDLAFWRFQAFWHRAQHKSLDYERADHWRQLEADFDRIRIEENRDRYSRDA